MDQNKIDELQRQLKDKTDQAEQEFSDAIEAEKEKDKNKGSGNWF